MGNGDREDRPRVGPGSDESDADDMMDGDIDRCC